MDNDQLLRDFFAEMKAKDQKIKTPEFPEVKARSINWWLPIGIAATLLLGGFYFLSPQESPDTSADLLIITLQENEYSQQELIIEEKDYIDVWESTTTSLLTDF